MTRNQREISSKFKSNLIVFFTMTVATKIISFIMIPFYTNYLSTEEYGTIALITTISELIIPVCTVCAAEGLFRFMFDDRISKIDAWKVSMYMFWRGIIFCGIGSILIYFIGLIDFFTLSCFFFLTVASGLNQILGFYYRGIDRTQILLETSVIHAIINFSLCILLVVKFHMGIFGYFVALCLGYFASSIYGCIRVRVFRLFYIRVNKVILKEIQNYAIPLIFTSIGWWIGNFIDRYVVTYFLGTSSNGIYDIAYRLPTIVSLISMIMNRAWTLTAISENKDKNEFACSLYNCYFTMLILGSSIIIFLNIPLAKILYAKDFFIAWRYTGPLIISAIFVALSNFHDVILQKEKDTKRFAKISIIVALSNTILSIILVNKFGMFGVAVGTLISNFIGWQLKIYYSKKYMDLNECIFRNFFVLGLLIVESILGLLGWNITIVLLNLSIIFIIGFFLKENIKIIFDFLIRDLLSRFNKK